jgi:hypothetical protein
MSDSKPSVGRGRPPEATRFKPGQSGNPAGRPKRIASLADDFRAELSQLVPAATNGETRVSKQRAIIRSMVQAAIQGDLKAAQAIFGACAKLLPGNGDESGLDDDELLDELTADESAADPALNEIANPASAGGEHE